MTQINTDQIDLNVWIGTLDQLLGLPYEPGAPPRDGAIFVEVRDDRGEIFEFKPFLTIEEARAWAHHLHDFIT